MRDDEWAQYCAFTTGGEASRDAAALGLWQLGGHRFTVEHADGMPACAGGYHEILPGTWQSWMVSTDRGWAEQWRSMTKAARWLGDQLLASGARRLQTNALAEREAAHEWYARGLGMRFEARMARFANNGEDILWFARLRGE